MQRVFDLAFNPKPHSCLGLRLLPLSLGHLFILARIRSPFIEGGSLSLVDLSDAVLICSNPFEEVDKLPRKWWFGWFLRFWGMRCRRINEEAEHGKFRTYFSEQTDFPIAKGESGPIQPGSPWFVRLLARAIGELNLSEDQALSLPANKLVCLLAAKSEAAGDVQLRSDEEEVADKGFEEFCNRMDAQPDLKFPPAVRVNLN